MLREEQKANPISAAQRKHFCWYGILVWVYCSLTVLYICIAVIMALISPQSLSAEQEGPPWWMLVVVILWSCSFVAMIFLFFWNMKFFLQTWREFRLARRTKLWQSVARARTGRRWPHRLMFGFGVYFFLITFVFTFVLLPFFLLRLVRKRLDMLRNADQLAALLTKLDVGEGPAALGQVAIPTAVFKEMGAIEDIHIQRRRAEAIDEFSHSGHGYAVLKSRAMIADIAKLDEASQLRVEACIAELASESLLADTTRECGGVWRIPVKETPYEIVCRQDNAARRIELLSLGQADGTSSARRTAEVSRG
jgi:hypothetical protein